MTPGPGDGPDDPGRSPTRATKRNPAPGAGSLGLTVFLISIGVLFAASLVAYAVVRLRADSWRPPGVAGLPAGLWVGTALLIACSVFVEKAVVAVRRGMEDRLVRYLWITLALAATFVLAQAWNWFEFHATGVLHRYSLYGFTFYMLTGLHVLHVLGGLVGLVFITARARKGIYSPANQEAVRFNATYWHFLGTVWLVLLGVLVFGG